MQFTNMLVLITLPLPHLACCSSCRCLSPYQLHSLELSVCTYLCVCVCVQYLVIARVSASERVRPNTVTRNGKTCICLALAAPRLASPCLALPCLALPLFASSPFSLHRLGSLNIAHTSIKSAVAKLRFAFGFHSSI